MRKRSADGSPGMLREFGDLDIEGVESEPDVIAYLRGRQFRGYKVEAAISWLGMYGTLVAVPVLKEATSSSDTGVKRKRPRRSARSPGGARPLSTSTV